MALIDWLAVSVIVSGVLVLALWIVDAVIDFVSFFIKL